MKLFIAFLLAILIIASIFTLAMGLNNNQEKIKYEFLKEAGHNVAYLDYGIFDYCAYKKNYGVFDCDYEYRKERAAQKFANSNNEEKKNE